MTEQLTEQLLNEIRIYRRQTGATIERCARHFGISNCTARMAYERDAVAYVRWLEHRSEKLIVENKIRPILTAPPPKKTKARHKVLCTETGIIFPNISAAARWVGCTRLIMSKICSGQVKSIRDYHFEYV